MSGSFAVTGHYRAIWQAINPGVVFLSKK